MPLFILAALQCVVHSSVGTCDGVVVLHCWTGAWTRAEHFARLYLFALNILRPFLCYLAGAAMTATCTTKPCRLSTVRGCCIGR